VGHLPEEESAILREDLRRYIKEHPGLTFRELGKLLADASGRPSAFRGETITQFVGGRNFGQPKGGASYELAEAISLLLGKPVGYWRRGVGGQLERVEQPIELARRYQLDPGVFVVVGLKGAGVVDIKEMDRLPDAVRRGVFGASCLLRIPLERALAIAVELMEGRYRGAVGDDAFGPEFWYERIRDARGSHESGSHPTPPGMRAAIKSEPERR